jgi:hypothetical protein
MNKYQSFACGQIFHSFPDIDIEGIIELCEDDAKREAFNADLEDTDNEDQQLLLCERYETEWWENIPALLEELTDAAMRHFPEA